MSVLRDSILFLCIKFFNIQLNSSNITRCCSIRSCCLITKWKSGVCMFSY